jgi:hypothetical protein
MPLDWTEVLRRYGEGGEVATAPGRSLRITGADDDAIHIASSLWKDALARADLEKAVRLIEDGRLARRAVPDARHPRSFAEEYRQQVADVRGSSVAYILRDLGHLE